MSALAIPIEESQKNGLLGEAEDFFISLEGELAKMPNSDASLLSEEGDVFYEHSVKEALILANRLKRFLSLISQEEFVQLRQVIPLFRSKESLSSHLIEVFKGDFKHREKIFRAYVSKAIESYKVIKMVSKRKALYQGMPLSQADQHKAALKSMAEATLRQIIHGFPQSLQLHKSTNPVLMARKQLYKEHPIFPKDYPFDCLTKNVRKLMEILLGHDQLGNYLYFKDLFFLDWLYEELFYLDKLNLSKSLHKQPEYSLIKLKFYQRLDQVFTPLSSWDRTYPKEKELRKSHYVTLSNKDRFLDQSELSEKAMKKAREAEFSLLSAFSRGQMAALAKNVYRQIVIKNQENGLPGVLPPGLNVRLDL